MSFERLTIRVAAVAQLVCALSFGQTTQGLITGRISDLRNGQPVPNCQVTATFRADAVETSRSTTTDGSYILAPLSPGAYDLRIDCAQYQGQEAHNVKLDVAALLVVNLRVRVLSEVWEDNYSKMMVLPDASLLTLYGPDVDLSHTALMQSLRGSPGALEATISQTVGSGILAVLPLSGRDAYTLLVLQPGVTSDSGTSRSLGLSVNGQRPSASKFLLDGIENDNPLVTGPLSPIAPEALGEYRISSNSFSAEYGRVSGYVSNAVTRSGTLGFHGAAYFYVRNEKLMARGPRVPGGDAAAPFRELQPGFALSGPLRKKWSLLGSLSWETARVYTRQPPQNFTVLTKSYIDALNPNTLAYRWLHPYAGSAPAGSGDTATSSLAPPLHLSRQTYVPRVDWTSTGGTQHLSERYAGFLTDRPEYSYNPYPGFSVGITESTEATAVSWTALPRPNLANELRLGFSVDSFAALRPHSDVPILTIVSSLALPQGVVLPSSNASGSFSNRTRSVELDDNLTLYGHKHIVRGGGGLIARGVSGIFSSYDAPRFDFETLQDFARDIPDSIQISVSRIDPLTSALPDFNRQYSIVDWYGFVQDSFRPWQRLTLSGGLRYDWFGAPSNTGRTKDYTFSLPSNGSVPDRLAAASLVPATGPLYDIRHNGLAVRTGLSLAFDRNAATVLRAAYGIYTDRPFDNLWQTIRNNDYLEVLTGLNGSAQNYADVHSVLRALPASAIRDPYNDFTTFAPDFSTPRVSSWMAGVQHSLSSRLLIEADYLGSGSSSLVTTDRLNRRYSTASGPSGRYQAALPDVIYRANQGRSKYSAGTFLLRYQSPRLSAGISYTLSRARDTQSDPQAGEFFDLSFGSGGLSPKATFIVQGDPSHDWGPADFDRRHNLAIMSSWMLPGRFEGFRLSFLGSARSGSPFTVFGIPTQVSSLLDNPADLVPGLPVWAAGNAAGNGVQLLNRAAFVAVSDHIGNSGRNGFYGPGVLGADASLSRRFHIPRLPEQTVLYLRADLYNVFNHANLGNPDTNLSHSTFGIATRGSQSAPNAFRIFAPLGDARRQAQLMLKFEF